MSWRVLVSAPYMLTALERLLPLFQAHGIEPLPVEVQERLTEEALIPLVAGIDGAICGDDSFTARVLEHSPRLRVIAKWGTGIDSIDLDACRARGVVVRNTPGAFSGPVADTVLGYILSFARGLVAMNHAMHSGIWSKHPGRALGELTLGVVGVGNCGKAVVERAVAFGMRVLGTDPVPMPASFLAASGITMVNREVLLIEADFVSLNCDLNPTSFHLLDEDALNLMKPSAVVINTSRGAVVDEPALVRALAEGRIGGAALDVFESEPLPADSPLRGMDNVLLAPHNANASPRAWEHVHQATIQNLVEELEGSSR